MRNKQENTRKTGGGPKINGQVVSKLQNTEVAQKIASLIRF